MNLRYQPQLRLALTCVAFIVPRVALAFQPQPLRKLVAPPQSALVENGRFRLYKFEQLIGEELYHIASDGDGVTVAMNFKFTDRGTEVPLSSTFHSATDLTPETFEIKGKTARRSEIDQAVDVRAKQVRVRDREEWTETARPRQFFTIAGYAPITMQMLLFRYWATHGSPTELVTVPGGRVKIEPRGTDSISLDDRSELLERYNFEGLIWGRETLWFDSGRNLIAIVTTDAEFDHFEAVREGYEGALRTFVGRAGADGMVALGGISKGIAGSQPATIVLSGGMLVDGTSHPALPDAAVVIDHGRITAVGPRSKIRVPTGAEVVDARGKTILPGLWDMHAHFEQVEWGPIYLAAGVTTVRDCGNEFEFITSVRDAVARGQGLGPRILAAGMVDGSGPFAIGIQRIDTPDQTREWVRRYHDSGFQQMKIYSSVKLEELRVVAEEAHRLGMTVTGHVPQGLNAYQAIEAGQDQINHIEYVLAMMHPPLTPESKRIDRMRAASGVELSSPDAEMAVTFLKSHAIVIDPTLAVYELETASTAKPAASFEPGVNKVAREIRAQLIESRPPGPDTAIREAFFAKALATVGALHRAGVTVVAGTDQAVPGHSLHREIELYSQAGFTPLEAIQSATIVPARVMGLDKELGTVEVGKRADLILLDGNPLVDIHNIRQVSYVMTGGKIFSSADLWRSIGFKP